MFENTKKALEVFQKAVECAQCKTPKKDLQYLGTSCKHAQCWDCIKEISTRQPGRRSTSRNHCSTCAFPLDITKIAGAHVLNTCFDTLTELKELLEKAQSMPPLSQVDMACTQRMLGDFDDEKCDEIDKKRAVERFLETQGHMPDCDVGEENFAVKTEQSENRDISPELDLFNDYGGRMSASAAQENSSEKRASSKRPSTSSIGDPEFERKPKRTSILKPAPPAEQFELFASQIPKRTHENEMLTPFVNRRSTAPVTGKVGEYAHPLKSASYSGKSEMFPSTDDDDPFTKKIVLTKRQASMEQQAKVVKKEPTPESEDFTPRSRRSAVKFAPSRSQSPMSFGERSMAVKTEQRRSSYGTRRGEVVIINSILNNRIPQLKTALEEGTCVNERDNQGKTPLYIAVEQNSLEAVEILVEAGAVINACCGSTYETTLHEAVRRKNLPIIEYLLSKGASMKIKNSAGNTAEDLGKNEAKIRKVLEKFKNEHVLQPVIPPPKSKIHFVQLIDEKMIRESDKKKLPGKINLVSMDMATPTHLVVPVDLKTKVLNVTKEHIGEVLKAIVKSTMIVSREWLKACIIDPSRAEDDRNYAVKKVQWMDGPVYTNRIEEWKKTISKMQPKLFAGCKFYFSRPKYNFLDRVTLIELVRIADGQASAREPILDDKNPAPYHNSNLKPNFIVYSLTHDIGDKFRDCTKYNLVCEQWLIESILGCSILTPPY